MLWFLKLLQMFVHTGDTKMVCAVMSFIEISGAELVRYDKFGLVLPIPNQNGGVRFQIKLVEVFLVAQWSLESIVMASSALFESTAL